LYIAIHRRLHRDGRHLGRGRPSNNEGDQRPLTYILIETAKLNAVDPHAWLADTLARIPDYKITKVDELMPWRWNG
jgi:hypothetical protein